MHIDLITFYKLPQSKRLKYVEIAKALDKHKADSADAILSTIK